MPKTIDRVRQLEGRRNYYRRASSYDAARVREIDRELIPARIERFICETLDPELPLAAADIDRLTSLLRGADK